ncbi:hypothetical protein Ae201684P_004846 [Aphanomyces euteiches]|nr:hypothetical protein Ae201684P_004608 [Aphanomyces euteiches]KAH9069155.1 hypothetical protein Ae201684P_004846 [Aphanomyces euteiches]
MSSDVSTTRLGLILTSTTYLETIAVFVGGTCNLCGVVAFGREQVQGDKFLDGLWLWDGKLVLRVWNDLSRPEDLHGSKTKTMLLQRHFQASHDASLLLLGRFCIVQPAPQ